MKSQNNKLAAHIVAILTSLIWGTTFISTKIVLRDLEPLEVLVYRFIIGYIGIVLLAPKPLAFEGFKKEIWYFLAGFTGVTLYFLCENVALTSTLASNVGVIVSTAPMFTAILAFLFLKTEKPGKYFFIGFLIAISGILLINYKQTTQFHISPVGDLLAVGAAFVWAIYSIILKKHIQLSKNMIAVTRRILFYGLITMIPCGLFMGFSFDSLRTLQGLTIANLLYLGLGASTICYLTWNYSVEKLGALKASVYIYMVPAITIFASVLILKEPLTLTIVAGGSLTILGLVISEKKTKNKEKDKKMVDTTNSL